MRLDMTTLSDETSEHETLSQRLRIGRQLLTADGWQTIIGLMIFQETDQVVVWTPERPDDDTADREGWKLRFDMPVRCRLEPTAEQLRNQKIRDHAERRRLRRLAMAAAACPDWCIEHYDGDAAGRPARNHASEPLAVDAANIWTGDPVELGLWLERRDDRETGETTTIGVLEVRLLTDDVEMTPENMRLLAGKLMSLSDRASLCR